MVATGFGKGFDCDLDAGFDAARRLDGIFIGVVSRSLVDIVVGKLKIEFNSRP